MNKSAEHYLTTGRALLVDGSPVEAERAFRAAQNALAPHEPGYLSDVKDIQALIIEALENQIKDSAAALGRKGGSVKSEAKSEAARARNAARKAEGKPEGGRPRKDK